ncbi:MAG: histidine--tRNA ligase, partial [Candidatus Aenigmatarchaeota archaeon]
MKFQPPKGTKDYLPEEMIQREFVINTIKKIFETYGFDTIETPAFEDWKLLTKKCGEEIKEQIYKFKDKAGRLLGLRFDLTVPLARFIANNPQISKPFKRYVIAPVWRYEEIKAGRKRQFYQCDIDIVGVKEMEAEAECLACAVDCLKALGFKDFQIVINNRKILEGFLELASIPKEKSLDVFRAIDKLKKFGENFVKKELKKLKIKDKQIKELFKLINLRGNTPEILEKAREILKGVKIAEEGIEEIEKIYELSKSYDFSNFLIVDLSLARGLDYYTGPIFEIIAKTEKQIGSIAGGGRYDNLIGLLGGASNPATGISFGIERIVEVMKEEMLNLPKTKVKVFVVNVNFSTKSEAIRIAQELRKNGINTQIDLMNRNITRQLEYCDSIGIPLAVIVGPKEIGSGIIKVKDLVKRK